MSIILMGVAYSAQVSALSIAIDGDLNDWLAAPPSGSSADWNPLRASTRYGVEDEPIIGKHDAEAIYVDADGVNLYVAIVTGLNPYPLQWKPGDIAIDFGSDGIFEYGLVTVGDAVADPEKDHWNAGIGIAGQLYRVDRWNIGPKGGHDERHPTTVKAGSAIGQAAITYELAKYDGLVPEQLGIYPGDPHFLIEAMIPIELFGDDWGLPYTVHWTMGSVKDWIQVGSAVTSIPEPGTLVLLSAGILGIAGLRRK